MRDNCRYIDGGMDDNSRAWKRQRDSYDYDNPSSTRQPSKTDVEDDEDEEEEEDCEMFNERNDDGDHHRRGPTASTMSSTSTPVPHHQARSRSRTGRQQQRQQQLYVQKYSSTQKGINNNAICHQRVREETTTTTIQHHQVPQQQTNLPPQAGQQPWYDHPVNNNHYDQVPQHQYQQQPGPTQSSSQQHMYNNNCQYTQQSQHSHAGAPPNHTQVQTNAHQHHCVPADYGHHPQPMHFTHSQHPPLMHNDGNHQQNTHISHHHPMINNNNIPQHAHFVHQQHQQTMVTYHHHHQHNGGGGFPHSPHHHSGHASPMHSPLVHHTHSARSSAQSSPMIHHPSPMHSPPLSYNNMATSTGGGNLHPHSHPQQHASSSSSMGSSGHYHYQQQQHHLRGCKNTLTTGVHVEPQHNSLSITECVDLIDDEEDEEEDVDDDEYGPPQRTTDDLFSYHVPRHQYERDDYNNTQQTPVHHTHTQQESSTTYRDEDAIPRRTQAQAQAHGLQVNYEKKQIKKSRAQKKLQAPGKPGKPVKAHKSSRQSPPRQQVAPIRRSPSSSSSASGPSQASPKSNKTNSTKDEIVHFDWYEGQKFSGSVRYYVTKLLGEGTFGRVLEAKVDSNGKNASITENQPYVAVKVIRDVARYLENAKIEARILQDLRQKDPRNESRCLRMYEAFCHRRKFYCLVTEPLGESLYEFLKSNHFAGYYLTDIQTFAEQCLEALVFLHGLRLAHTDLKPENILLQTTGTYETDPPRPPTGWNKKGSKTYRRPKSASVKLIDFGNATYHHESHSSIVNTRQYRSPEVILNTGWNESGDLWCLGCILLELYTGELFFSTHENLEHLALIEKLLHPIPQHLVRNVPSETRNKFFRWDDHNERYELIFRTTATDKEIAHVDDQIPSKSLMYTPDHLVFSKFCEKLMSIDKNLRPHPKDALNDKFFTKHFIN